MNLQRWAINQNLNRIIFELPVMSWKIFLSPNTPPLVDPDQMNLHALSRRQRSSKRKPQPQQLKTESDRQHRLCSISRMLLRQPSEPSPQQLALENTSTLTEINETLKEMRLLAIDGNSTLHRFLDLMEKNIALKTSTKAKSSAKTSRDQKSTVKKRVSKLASRLQDKINGKIGEFEKVRKEVLKKSMTAATHMGKRKGIR